MPFTLPGTAYLCTRAQLEEPRFVSGNLDCATVDASMWWYNEADDSGGLDCTLHYMNTDTNDKLSDGLFDILVDMADEVNATQKSQRGFKPRGHLISFLEEVQTGATESEAVVAPVVLPGRITATGVVTSVDRGSDSFTVTVPQPTGRKPTIDVLTIAGAMKRSANTPASWQSLPDQGTFVSCTGCISCTSRAFDIKRNRVTVDWDNFTPLWRHDLPLPFEDVPGYDRDGDLDE
ncbi:hypothetical protein EDB83DRAFT_2532874 [Lactarius deliciosus]|nr:hypothetical protein EDB83DRAFT_2532874 [Lactarius deliciosus]